LQYAAFYCFHSHPAEMTKYEKKVGLERIPTTQQGVNQKPARSEFIVLTQLLNFSNAQTPIEEEFIGLKS